MQWVIGVDEAGYGPNLGPLVQAAVAFRLPAHDPAGWDTLQPLVRRAHEDVDDRLLLDDSKAVYKGPNGLEKLERGLVPLFLQSMRTVAELLQQTLLASHHDDLHREPWFDASHPLPAVANHETIREDLKKFKRKAGKTGIAFTLAPARAAVVPTPRFNRVVDESDTKAAILARGLIELVSAVHKSLPQDGIPLFVVCDKQGGRNYYTSLIQSAFSEGWVIVEKESAEESRYRVDRLEREIAVVFRPRADSGSVSVAVASMLCKYLREVCMIQFNRYWARHVPGLVPTAGYPGDARRFYDAIRAAMLKLGLEEDQVWRKR